MATRSQHLAAHIGAILILAALLLTFSNSASAVTPVEVDKLVASDEHNNAFFGWRVAVDGDTVVVGAYRNNQQGNRAGAAYVYQRNTAEINCPATGNNDPWCEDAKLLAFGTDPFGNQRFGSMVAISGDTILVGANRDAALGTNAGSAYVFTKVLGVWQPQQKLLAPDGTDFDFFGGALVIDGDEAFISGGSTVYAFNRSGTTWSFDEMISPLDVAPGQGFGSVVSLSGDSLIVGAVNDGGAGAAYVFTRSGSSWTQQAKLQGSDSIAGDNFGAGAAIFGDTALIGAPRVDVGLGIDTGAAYVFTRNGTVWTQQTKLLSPGGGTEDFFGFTLALSGNTALIPSDLEDGTGPNSGAAYVYTGAGANWTLQAGIAASDAAADDAFGWGSALDGDTAVLGAPTNTFNWPFRPGAAYIFDINRSETPTGTDVGVDPQPVDESGELVEDAPDFSLEFDSVSTEGETSVTLTDSGPQLPDGFKLTGLQGGSFYFDIETTATFGGMVEICINYSGMSVAGNPEKLQFLHYDGEFWTDITSSNDTINSILCAMTSGFSIFVIAEIDNPVELLADLVAAIEAINANRGIINSFDAKIAAAEQALSDAMLNNDRAATNVLFNAFIQSVEAQRGVHISDAEADELIEKVQEIAALL